MILMYRLQLRLVWTIWTLLSAVPRKAIKFNHSVTHPQKMGGQMIQVFRGLLSISWEKWFPASGDSHELLFREDDEELSLAHSMHYSERPSALSRVFALCLHPVQMVWRKFHSSLTHGMTAWDVQQSLDPSANHATKPMQEVQNSYQIIKTPIYDHASYGTKFMYFISKAWVEERNVFMGHLHMMEASTNGARSTPFKGSHLRPNLKKFVQEILRLREHLSLYGGLSMDSARSPKIHVQEIGVFIPEGPEQVGVHRAVLSDQPVHPDPFWLQCMKTQLTKKWQKTWCP